MNLEQYWTEFEQEQKWRIDEIRFFENLIAHINDKNQQDQYRRALILILYSHYEGFCKFAFMLYIEAINQMGLSCNQVCSQIAVASIQKKFKAIRNPHQQCEFSSSSFCKKNISKFRVECDLIESINGINKTPVKLNDNLIDAKSNLTPDILETILFRLGFPHDLFKNLKDQINKLLQYRNNIAHGRQRQGISKKDYDSLRADVFIIIKEIKSKIMDALTNKLFLK